MKTAMPDARCQMPDARCRGIRYPASRSPLLVLISAPSGAGKTTLSDELLKTDPLVQRAITCTTRAPRPGEQDGVHYHFLDPATFQQRVAAGEFLEHATVHGNSYGTLQSEVLTRLHAGHDVLLNIDVQGAASVRACAAESPELARALCEVFVVAPSLPELERRLRTRASDAEEVIQRRLAAAREEMARWTDFDYLVVNDSLPAGLRRLEAIIEAERMRVTRVEPPEL